MKTLNKKNLEQINALINTFAVSEHQYQRRKDAERHTSDRAMSSYFFYTNILTAIELYEQFSIALLPELMLIATYIPQKAEYQEKADTWIAKAAEFSKEA